LIHFYHWKFNYITKTDFGKRNLSSNEFAFGPMAHATLVYKLKKINQNELICISLVCEIAWENGGGEKKFTLTKCIFVHQVLSMNFG